MANDFDEFPLDDPIIKKGTEYLSGDWRGSLSTFWQTLTTYISAFGFFPPNLTSTQRDSIQNPQNGQMIYNTTVDAPQFYQVSSASWRTYSFT